MYRDRGICWFGFMIFEICYFFKFYNFEACAQSGQIRLYTLSVLAVFRQCFVLYTRNSLQFIYPCTWLYLSLVWNSWNDGQDKLFRNLYEQNFTTNQRNFFATGRFYCWHGYNQARNKTRNIEEWLVAIQSVWKCRSSISARKKYSCEKVTIK